MFKRLFIRFVKWKDKKIHAFFYYYINNRIDNNLALYFFYFIFYISERFYIEKDFKIEKHHYIPKYILKNFKISETNQIYEYSKNKKSPQRRSIDKEVACKSNFYSFFKIKRTGLSNFIEKNLFAEIVERFGKDVISNVVKKEFKDIISIEKNILATHVAFQYTRTPAFQEQLKIYILYLLELKKISIDIFSNKQKKKLEEIFLENSLKISLKDVQDFARKKISSKKDINKLLRKQMGNLDTILLHLSIIIGSYQIKNLFYKTLTILNTKDPYNLILPDSGSIICNINDPHNRWPYGWDLSTRSITILTPISPNTCIVFTSFPINKKIENTFIELCIGCSYYQKLHYLYSNKKTSLIQNNLNQIKTP